MTQPRVIIVTGGTSGIGEAAAEALVEQGDRVVIAARDPERGRAVADRLNQASGEERCLFVPTDIADPQAVDDLLATTVERFGRLDAALNNAASFTATQMARLGDVTPDDFDRSLATNLRGTWLCLRAEIRQMLAQGPSERGGYAIVNTSSINGLGGAPYGSTYAAAKAALLALTKSAAFEYASERLRINALVPGCFDTPMLRAAFDAQDAMMGAPGAAEPATVGRIPLARLGAPREAAAAAVWLLGPEASYVIGHSMIVDGGLTALMR